MMTTRREEDLFWLWAYLNGRSVNDLRNLRRVLTGRTAATVRFGHRRFPAGDVISAVNHYIEEKTGEIAARKAYQEAMSSARAMKEGALAKKAGPVVKDNNKETSQ